MSDLAEPVQLPEMAEPFCLRRPILGGVCFLASFAQFFVNQAVRRTPVQVIYPDGTVRGGGDASSPRLEVVRPKALHERMGHNPKIGLGEAYMAGDWRVADGSDLGEALTPFAARLTALVPEPWWKLRIFVDTKIPHRHKNTPEGSRRNIGAHYDLSNDLFATFLDPTMTYSSAMFDPERPAAGQDLEQAQYLKLDAILDQAGVTAGSRVLEIGTGWGALAIRAAGRGAHVTTVTLSTEQLEMAQGRVSAAGVADMVDIRLQDYRAVTGQFDAIVSVEMIEAVGEEFWPTYFSKIDSLLAPGGKVAIQAILMPHQRMLATRKSFGWIQKYIFPGGLIPSYEAIENTVAAHTTLRVTQRHDFGQDYAETLRRWRASFTRHRQAVEQLGFDENFMRMWEFYLAYSEAGFASDYLQVSQIQMQR
jgi:cyclopropane-fatty-acyl-phospholipid synthase